MFRRWARRSFIPGGWRLQFVLVSVGVAGCLVCFYQVSIVSESEVGTESWNTRPRRHITGGRFGAFVLLVHANRSM